MIIFLQKSSEQHSVVENCVGISIQWSVRHKSWLAYDDTQAGNQPDLGNNNMITAYMKRYSGQVLNVL